MSCCRSLLSSFLALAALSSTWSSSAHAQDNTTTPLKSDVEFTNWLSALKGEGVDVTNAGFSYDAATERLTVKGLKLTFGAATAKQTVARRHPCHTYFGHLGSLRDFPLRLMELLSSRAAVQGVSLDGASWAGARLPPRASVSRMCFFPV